VARSLSLARVLALVGGLGLVAAFYMPWFSSQGLLLSGQFLHTFLSTASPADLGRFLPSSSPTEVQLLRTLVDVFPVCGALAAVAVLAGGLVRRARPVANSIQALAGVIPLLGWAGGVTRLPPGANPEVGLALIAAGALAILLGLVLDLRFGAAAARVS
jgi:hypothetical protein